LRTTPAVYWPALRYTFGQRLAARGVGALSQIVFGFTLRHVRHECRWHLAGPLDAALRDGGQLILAAWHQDVLPLFHYLCQLTLLEQRRRFVMLSSRSFDGELTERVLAPFGFEFVRGSAGKRGGQSALRSLHRHVEQGRDVVVIADGPRPPAFAMKGGPLQLARASGVPLYVARASARPALILPRSWTRMTLPLPRCDLALFSGGPVDTRGSFEEARSRAESELHGLAEELDAHLYLRRRVRGGIRFPERGL
jgi:lysophospholipid acyltransferase (LPLAT)-like uncharacterized protein